MRKTVLAAAIIGALAAASTAQAQSSVTLFGVADAGIGYGSGSLSSKQQVLSGGNLGSRFGLRGTEDLGGGLTASFWLEAGLTVDDGMGAANNTNNQATGAVPAGGLQFNRRSTISLAGNWGELRLGRDYTPHYFNRLESDPFGFVGVGVIQPNTPAQITGVTGSRASNSIGYLLPENLGGFTGRAQIYRGENVSTSVNSQDGNGASIRLGYGSGPWAVSVATGTTHYATTATAGDIRVDNIAARYDFGVAKLLLGYYKDRVARTVPLTARGYSIGTIVPVGAHQFKLAYSRYGTDAAGSPDSNKWSVGYVHNLSKRTALYATAARVGNSGGASAALNGSTTAANQSSRGYDLGIRHSF